MTALTDYPHLVGIALSLALGLLVGVQRGWALRDLAAGSRFAGVRTFALIAMAGGIAGVLYDQAKGPATSLMVAVMVLVLLGYERVSRRSDRIDGTSVVVALLTLASGFLVGTGDRLTGTSVAVVMVLVLAMREQLHRWVKHLSEAEVLSIARFALIAMVILPLLPDRAFGPYLVWNPQKLWLIVVLVCGFSFTGYFAARALGSTRAIIATAAAGSMVSSTAVTASLATQMKQGSAQPANLAAGISAASVVMFIRVLALTGMLAPAALPELARLVAPAIAVSLGATGWYLRKSRHHDDPALASDRMAMRNPFDLAPALMLTGLVMILSIASHWVMDRFGDRELAVVLALSGMVDVDSAIITLGGLPAGTLPPHTAGLVLAVPAALNTLVKAGIAVTAGGWNNGRHGAIPLVASALAIPAAWLLFR